MFRSLNAARLGGVGEGGGGDRGWKGEGGGWGLEEGGCRGGGGGGWHEGLSTFTVPWVPFLLFRSV
jgi:hypothetical protein